LFVSLSLLCGSIKLVYYSLDSIRCEAGKRQSHGQVHSVSIVKMTFSRSGKKVFEMVKVDADVQVFTAAEGRPNRLNLRTYWIRESDHATYTWDLPPRLRRRQCLLTWNDPVRVSERYKWKEYLRRLYVTLIMSLPPTDFDNVYRATTLSAIDSLYFPNTTTTILEVHTDEVWNIEWSHNGEYLASAGKDKSAIIWRVGVSWYLSLLQSSTDSKVSLARERASSERVHTTSCAAGPPIPCGMYNVVSGRLDAAHQF